MAEAGSTIERGDEIARMHAKPVVRLFGVVPVVPSPDRGQKVCRSDPMSTESPKAPPGVPGHPGI
ncbi:hypothetical protein [Kribbella sp. NPDC049584]|uniref:hypothetical protein n=1 Tax=Kribbella sp. NPDC049584 TaxID=3154833 RepID=UPI00342BB655